MDVGVLAAEVAFWISVTGVFYPYLLFPLILLLCSWSINARICKQPITPSVSVIIAAHNEEAVIAEKLGNMLAMDYPHGLLQIIVVSDGSTDNTVEIVRNYREPEVKCLDLPRRGKVFALIDAVRASSGEVLVFTDANTMFEPQALRKLVESFADKRVGGVCGNQLHARDSAGDTSSQGEQMYWSYDKWLKELESRTGSIVSADGAIYAIRSKLFQAPKSAAVTDDFAISTRVIEKGYRLVFEPEARATEPSSTHAGKEFGRKVRIINRGLRSVLLRKNLLNPFRYGLYSLILFSHKVSRRLVPLFLILVFISNLFLVHEHIFYLLILLGQIVFYVWASISFLLKDNVVGKNKLFFAPFFFCLANLAALVALYYMLTGKRIAMWNPQR